MACCPYSILMANIWTSGQDYLSLVQIIYILYKQYKNMAETSCQVLL